MRTAYPPSGSSPRAWCAAIASLAVAAGCEVRSGIMCKTDPECGDAGVCIAGLCFSSDGTDAGRPVAGECDAGETAACAGSLGEVCLLGSRACEEGIWGACVPSVASADVARCGTRCGPCGTGADRCEQGICRCGATPACDPGLRCARGACACDADSCQGCCAGSVCAPIAFPLCGSPGGACATCDPVLADQCSPLGGCQCGQGPQCSAGQRCVQGACACDAVSCPQGCCDGSTCRQSSMLSCGTAGGVCVSCDPVLADRCLASGTCACGSGPPCASGQRCLEGLCICNPCWVVAGGL